MVCFLGGPALFGYDLRPSATSGRSGTTYFCLSMCWIGGLGGCAGGSGILLVGAWKSFSIGKKIQGIRCVLFSALGVLGFKVCWVRAHTYGIYSALADSLGDARINQTVPPRPTRRRQGEGKTVPSLRSLCTDIVACQPSQQLQTWSLNQLPGAPDSTIPNNLARAAARVSAQQLVAVCQELPQLTELDLGPVSAELTAEQAKAIFRACPNLKVLSCRNCWQLDAEVWGELVNCCSKLESLDLTSCRKVDGLGQGPSTLTHLTLSYCAFSEIQELMKKLESPLEALTLPDGLAPGFWMDAYLSQHGNTMRLLQANPGIFADQRSMTPQAFPEHCPELESWYLHLDQAVLPKVPSWANDQLRSLSLYGCSTSNPLDSVLEQLCAPLSNLQSLRICLPAGEGISSLADSLSKHAKKLTSLRIACEGAGEDLTSADVDALAKACPSLTELRLGRNFVLDHSTCKRLVNALPHLKQLTANVRDGESEYDPNAFASMIDLQVSIPPSELLNTLEACPQLKQLNPFCLMEGPRTRPTFEEDLARLISRRPNSLEVLVFQVTPFTEKVVSSILLECPEVKELWISVLGILSQEQWRSLLKSIPPGTERLVFHSSRFLSTSELQIAIEACPQIRTMVIVDTNRMDGQQLRNTLADSSISNVIWYKTNNGIDCLRGQMEWLDRFSLC